MNKKELVQVIANKAKVTQDVAEACLNGFTESVTKSLKKGDNVTLVGFGTFTTKKRSARDGRNPKTGEIIKIAATKVPGFKAGKALKDAVKG